MYWNGFHKTFYNYEDASQKAHDTLAITQRHFLIDRPQLPPTVHGQDAEVHTFLLKKWNLIIRFKRELWSA